MKLTLIPLDNNNPMELSGVTGFTLEGPTLLVIFDSGRTRNYPLRHLISYHSFVENYKHPGPLQRLTLSWKDDLNKAMIEDVAEYAIQGQTLMVALRDGTVSNYPLMHLWYYESHVDFHKTAPLVDSAR